MIHTIKKITAGVLVVTLLVPALFLAPAPKEAHAQYAVIEVGPNLLANTISSIEETLQEIKEYIADGLAYAIVNTIIQQMSRDMINWINSGFDGNPAFVDDIDGFLRGVGDRVAGDLILESGLGFLCSPFELDVRISIAKYYFDEDRNRCTLTDVIDNVDGFLGDFNTGGWQSWFTLTRHPENNPYGSFLLGVSEVGTRSAEARATKRFEIDLGSGFLSKRDCSGDVLDETPDGECPIVTPGSTIEASLAKTLGLSQDRLVIADEIDEVIGAFFSQLAFQALGGGGGLSGLSRSSSGRQAYIDRVANESAQEELILSRTRERIVPHLTKSAQNERAYRAAKQSSLNEIDATIARFEEVQTCYTEKLESGSLSTLEREEARDGIAAASSTIEALTPRRAGFTSDIDSSREASDTIDSITGRVAAAETLGAMNTAVNQFTGLQGNGFLHNIDAIFQAQQERDAIEAEMEPLLEKAADALRACENLGEDD